MKKIFNYLLTLFILAAIIVSLFFLFYFISKDGEISDKTIEEVCLDKKEIVLVIEKEIETGFLWEQTYVLVVQKNDGEKEIFTVSSEIYYKLEIGEQVYYCDKCEKLFLQ